MSARERLFARLALAEYVASANPDTLHLVYLVRGFLADVRSGQPIALVTDCAVPEGL